MSSFKDFSRRLRAPLNQWYGERRLRQYHAEPRDLDGVVDWAMGFGGGGYFRVKSLQRRPEILRLAETVRDLKPKLVLEIGTASGGTLLVWSALASEEVITCDLQDPTYRARLYGRLAPPGSTCKITLLGGDSHDAGFRQKVIAALKGRQVDFLFIDGDHTVGGVTADYHDYKEFVRPGGVIAFHDIVESQPLPTNQVYHFWKKLREVTPVEEFVVDPAQCGFGIGIMRVPAGGAPDVR